MKILEHEISSSDLVKYENPPKLVVKHWSSDLLKEPTETTLSMEFSKNQMFYTSVASTDDRMYRHYDDDDFQELADKFNNNEDIKEEWKASRGAAFEDMINYYKHQKAEAEKEIKELTSQYNKYKRAK